MKKGISDYDNFFEGNKQSNIGSYFGVNWVSLENSEEENSVRGSFL